MSTGRVTGSGASNFDSSTLLDVGRSLVVTGEYCSLVWPKSTLTQVFKFSILPGPLGSNGPGKIENLKYETEAGKEVITDDFVHVKYSTAKKGRGAGSLQNARRLYKIAANLEVLISGEISGVNGTVIPVPALNEEELEKHADEVSVLNGKTLFVETFMQGMSSQGVQQPKNDYESIKIQPKISPEWLRLCELTDESIYRACGIPLSMVSSNVNTQREDLRQFWTMGIESYSRLLVDAAAKKNISIEIDFNFAQRFDQAAIGRTLKLFAESEYPEGLATQRLGLRDPDSA